MADKRKRIQFSPETLEYIQSQLNYVPGMNTQSNNQQTYEVEKITKQVNKRIADNHAHRAVQERDQKRRTPNVDVTKGNSNTLIQDADKIALNRALSWQGLSNGLGQMTNIPDNVRNSPEFANFIGKDVPLSMLTTGSFVAAPQTALFGMGTSLGGNYIGGKIGEKLGNKEAGQTIGSFIGPIAASGFNAAILPTVRKTFANEFGTSYGYNQLMRVPYFTKTLLKGGARKYPKVKIDQETGDQSVFLIEKSRPKVYEQENPAEIGRAQATSKYSGAPDSETPFYLKNSNGSYQYDLEQTPYSQLGLFINRKGPEALKRTPVQDNKSIVWGDFLGNNGGNVRVRYDGQFTLPNGETYNRYMMQDVWDLQPVPQLAGKLGKAINSGMFRLGTNIESKLIPRVEIAKSQKITNPIYKAGENIQSTINKIGNSKLINREVGRIVGGKPFTLEHPFAVKTSVVEKAVRPTDFQLKGNSINLFRNEAVPEAQYSTPYELNLNMPFDFNRVQKNLVYPLFNVEHVK